MPPAGFNHPETQSHAATVYMMYYEHKHNVQLQRAGHPSEKRVGPYRCDGFDANSNTIIEVNGCFW